MLEEIQQKLIGEFKVFFNNSHVKLMEEYKKHLCQRVVDSKSVHYSELKKSLKNHSAESNLYSKISMGIEFGKF